MYVQAIILSLLLLMGATSEVENLQKGTHWSDAATVAESQSELWNDVFSSFDLSAEECQAIVFPEMMRYSTFQDGVEEAALLALYVSGGKELSNFSIGYFQMKPSFAEEVEAAWMASPLRHEYQIYFPRGESREARRRRVERLADKEWQCVYLAIFVRMLLDREPSLLGLSAEDRVALLATAYNYSFTASLDDLRIVQSRKNFHLGIFKKKETYCYSEIAVRRYREIATPAPQARNDDNGAPQARNDDNGAPQAQ